ncbi:MAG: precorrin-4 C(11)-methyltransferase [Actinobacteria bacterium]|nr:precorrin-4 C(11)-methyltransferase [Actinomycetota bacterium]
MNRQPMISFVGAGPGAADLITLRGALRLSRADIVIWASSLVPEALLMHCSKQARVHDSAVMTLEDVTEVYRSNPKAAIVRLHSGDPSIYGAIQEQIDWCLEHQRSFEIVPGVSSLGAAAAAIGRELTVPKIAQSVVLTRLASRTSGSMPALESLPAFAVHGATMAIFLSASRPRQLAKALLAPDSAYTPETPAVIVVRASWPDQQVIATTIGSLAEDLLATGVKTTVLVLVGEAVGSLPAPRSHLYSPNFAHGYRKRSQAGSTAGRPAAGATAGTRARRP